MEKSTAGKTMNGAFPGKPADKWSKWGMAGAVISAVAAGACCVGPLLLMALGVSGVWIGSLTALEPYSPIFMALAFVFLGSAFYKVYSGKSEKASCVPGNSCSRPGAKRLNKIILWIFTALVIGLLIFPFAVPYVFADSAGAGPATSQETLKLSNMTCPVCAIPVRRSLEKLDGVKKVTVTMDPPQAVVIYDPAKVTPEDLTSATTNAGYPSTVAGAGEKK